MKYKEINSIIDIENYNIKRYLIILTIIMISFIYSQKIMAQIEGLYNQNSEQFAGISNLMSATSGNDVDGVRFFSKAGTYIVNQKNKGGATALHIASREGNLSIVKILIDAGANTNLIDNEGYTPLMRASLMGNSEIVEYLLNNGADVGILNAQKESVLIHATSSKCNECLNLIINKGELIKIMDTLILKDQIASSIVIANNQDNIEGGSILYNYLDYVSKTAPLLAKSDSNLIPLTTINNQKIDLGINDNIFIQDENLNQSTIDNNNELNKSEVPKVSNLKQISVPEKKFIFKKHQESLSNQLSDKIVDQNEVKKSNPDSTKTHNISVKKYKLVSVAQDDFAKNTNVNSELISTKNVEIKINKEEKKGAIKQFLFKQQIDKSK